MDSISTQRKPSPEQAKKELAEQLWLSYYNQVLFEAGLITETERNRMKNKISTLTPSASNEVTIPTANANSQFVFRISTAVAGADTDGTARIVMSF